VKSLRFLVATAWLLAFIAIPAAHGQSDKAPTADNASVRRRYGGLRSLFLNYYPGATSHLLNQKMHFEHDTRMFIVHEPLKTGEWQDPWETRGPKRGGILCDVTLQEGRYQGAAVVPQTFDKRYFQVLLMAPYNPKQDRHLQVHLSYPGNVKPEFLKEFTDLVNAYSTYQD
jgi:hypothetical protein